MKLVDGIVDVLYSPQQAETKINDHVKHDMNDDPHENEKTAEVTGEEHLDRGTVKDDADNEKLVGGIVDVLYSAQRTKKSISQCSTTILSSTIRTTAWKKKQRRLSSWRLQESQVMNVPIETQKSGNISHPG